MLKAKEQLEKRKEQQQQQQQQLPLYSKNPQFFLMRVASAFKQRDKPQ